MTFFHRDLNKEQLLGKFLDSIYPQINIEVERNNNIDLQHKGVDLIYKEKENIFIDEKAQLDYLNSNLPTFTFELSYLKNEEYRLGWLFDESKLTTHYFLITGIYAKNINDLTQGFIKCIITSVNRSLLIKHLNSKGLTYTVLYNYEKQIRSSFTKNKKHLIKELNSKTEGILFYSPQLSEKPINLQLKLNYLIEIGVAKRIYPI